MPAKIDHLARAANPFFIFFDSARPGSGGRYKWRQIKGFRRWPFEPTSLPICRKLRLERTPQLVLTAYRRQFAGFGRQLRGCKRACSCAPQALAERAGRVLQSLFVAVDQLVPDGIVFGIDQLARRIGVEPGQRLANALCKTASSPHNPAQSA